MVAVAGHSVPHSIPFSWNNITHRWSLGWVIALINGLCLLILYEYWVYARITLWCCCPMSWRFCSFGSASPAPLGTPSVHKWDRYGVGEFKSLDLGLGDTWVCQPHSFPAHTPQGELSSTVPCSSLKAATGKGRAKGGKGQAEVGGWGAWGQSLWCLCHLNVSIHLKY